MSQEYDYYQEFVSQISKNEVKRSWWEPIVSVSFPFDLWMWIK